MTIQATRGTRAAATTGATDPVATMLRKLGAGSAKTRARKAIDEIRQGREQRELGEIQIRRGIFVLHDAGASQRDIAAIAGISQPEVHRRLRRRALHSPATSPREVILLRAAGEIDTEEMLRRLRSMPLTAKVPGRRAATDGAAGVTGTAKQLMTAFRQGLLSEQEYEAVRAAHRTAGR